MVTSACARSILAQPVLIVTVVSVLFGNFGTRPRREPMQYWMRTLWAAADQAWCDDGMKKLTQVLVWVQN